MKDTIPTSFKLPTRQAKSVQFAVQIPEHIFGHYVHIQARSIDIPREGKDVCDGNKCYQTKAKAHVKFFSRQVNWDELD